jgi:2',3'-cyclic-nucleotide 2'-phosphodiesterase (5'-nucleotidase family)
MKLIPYLLIRNNKVKRNDIIFSIFIYGIYIVWLYITGKNIIDLLNEYIIRIKKDKALGPITTFLEKTIKSYS